MRLLLTRLSQLCSSTLRSAHMRGLVPATSPLKSLHEGLVAGLVPRTVYTKRFEEQVAGTCSKKFKLV